MEDYYVFLTTATVVLGTFSVFAQIINIWKVNPVIYALTVILSASAVATSVLAINWKFAVFFSWFL